MGLLHSLYTQREHPAKMAHLSDFLTKLELSVLIYGICVYDTWNEMPPHEVHPVQAIC